MSLQAAVAYRKLNIRDGQPAETRQQPRATLLETVVLLSSDVINSVLVPENFYPPEAVCGVEQLSHTRCSRACSDTHSLCYSRNDGGEN